MPLPSPHESIVIPSINDDPLFNSSIPAGPTIFVSMGCLGILTQLMIALVGPLGDTTALKKEFEDTIRAILLLSIDSVLFVLVKCAVAFS